MTLNDIIQGVDQLRRECVTMRGAIQTDGPALDDGPGRHDPPRRGRPQDLRSRSQSSRKPGSGSGTSR